MKRFPPYSCNMTQNSACIFLLGCSLVSVGRGENGIMTAYRKKKGEDMGIQQRLVRLVLHRVTRFTILYVSECNGLGRLR
ncbi:hypothetical protein F4815DRAFT_459055 [Daldinia loculata]|nr:hypothetical protein F4815DRAFT_459055 [Daldinia loculata]